MAAQHEPRTLVPESLPAAFQAALAASAQPAMSSAAHAAADAPHLAASDDLCSQSMEQLALLEARAVGHGLNTDDQMLKQQLTEYLRVCCQLPLSPPACPCLFT
jgi:hypothetical protein